MCGGRMGRERAREEEEKKDKKKQQQEEGEKEERGEREKKKGEGGNCQSIWAKFLVKGQGILSNCYKHTKM